MDEDPSLISVAWGMVHSRSGRGDPGTMASPDPAPVNSASSPATRRPVRVDTVVATLDWSCTKGAMASTCNRPGCSTIPWRLIGWTTPDVVAKRMSTTSGVEVGLKSATKRAFDPVVIPLGKYQSCAVLLWHGASAQPDAPCSVSDTATPPPDRVTTSEIHVPDFGVGMRATSWRQGSTSIAVATLAPVSVTASIVPTTERAPVLVRTTEPGASSPAAVDCPVQYHAEDSAPGAPTRAAGAAGGPPGELFPGVRPARDAPASRFLRAPGAAPRQRPAQQGRGQNGPAEQFDQNGEGDEWESSQPEPRRPYDGAGILRSPAEG